MYLYLASIPETAVESATTDLQDAAMYCDPYTGEPLRFVPDAERPAPAGTTLNAGMLVRQDGGGYPVRDGIPNFVNHDLLASDADSLEWYRVNYATYDDYLPLTFRTFGIDEQEFRRELVAELCLEPSDKVLETGCGTGRDTEEIARHLSEQGKIWALDVSDEILREAKKKFEGHTKCAIQFVRADAHYLPFPDGAFDKVFHFGGFNTYGDKKRGLAEMVRVVRPGGKIVVGDESMPDWLRSTEFGRVLMHSNPHYRYSLPLVDMPIEARNVKIQYVLGGVFYVITFERGEGEPRADFDFQIPGNRGGTHRKRYYGQIEGVDPELRDAVVARARQLGVSTVQLIEEALERALKDD